MIAKPGPIHKNVKYGNHERNVLDFLAGRNPTSPRRWSSTFMAADSATAAKKASIHERCRSMLQAGISVAGLNYRYVTQAPLPAAHHDCRRAIQFLRSKAQSWNLDEDRFGAFGGSAGRAACMYLGFHDDMARPDSADPIERESTRLAAVVTNGGQTTMNIDCGSSTFPVTRSRIRDFLETFGAKTRQQYEERRRRRLGAVSY